MAGAAEMDEIAQAITATPAGVVVGGRHSRRSNDRSGFLVTQPRWPAQSRETVRISPTASDVGVRQGRQLRIACICLQMRAIVRARSTARRVVFKKTCGREVDRF